MKSRSVPLYALLALPLIAGCTDDASPTAALALEGRGQSAQGVAAPSSLTPVSFDGATNHIWPYTDTNFEATPQDPMNLVFVGHADPRNIRSALLSLNGDRGGAPFNMSGSGMLLAGVAQGCTWKDAVAGNQTTYSEAEGWSGSVIQLECGEFNSVRFHIRLFPAGEWTLANVHVDVLIPGTNQHEVLTWEAAEKFVMMELVRSGLLAAAPTETGVINEVGSFGTIRIAVYNGLPAGLRMLTGGPLTNVTQPVPVQTDGKATILALQEAPPAGGTSNTFTIQFGQFIPKPFCAQAGELVRVDGPVQVSQVVDVLPNGMLKSKTSATGTLTVRSFNPLTGALGELVSAEVEEKYEADIKDHKHLTTSKGSQRLYPAEGTPQEYTTHLRVGSDGRALFHQNEVCGS
jgi:hypothetical protein